MSHELHLWADDRKVAVVSHDAKDDHWALTYDEAWAADPQSFPLSPALPLVRPASGYPSSTLRRFIEHLLPEGRALDVAVAYNGLAKSNVFGLIRALGSETAGPCASRPMRSTLRRLSMPLHGRSRCRNWRTALPSTRTCR